MRLLLIGTALALAFSAHAGDFDSIDFSASDEEIKAQIAEITGDLTEEEQNYLGEGMGVVIMPKIMLLALSGTDVESVEGKTLAAAAIGEALRDQTVEGLIEIGKNEVAKKDEAQAQEASTKVEKDGRMKCIADNIVISNAKLAESYGLKEISVDVTNNLDWAVAGVAFHYTATEEGRSVPWGENDVWLKIDGGIEPGETKTVSTAYIDGAPENIADLKINAIAIDVLDPKNRQYVQDGMLSGAEESISEMTCKT